MQLKYCVLWFWTNLFVFNKKQQHGQTSQSSLYLQMLKILIVFLFYNFFIQNVFQVFKEYFKELEEESIRDNFVTVYELLDEVMDFGFPQTTESKILQE